jgi:hypothetical protein
MLDYNCGKYYAFNPKNIYGVIVDFKCWCFESQIIDDDFVEFRNTKLVAAVVSPLVVVQNTKCMMQQYMKAHKKYVELKYIRTTMAILRRDGV